MEDAEPRTVDPGVPLWVKVPLAAMAVIVVPLAVIADPWLLYHLLGAVGLWLGVAVELLMVAWVLFARHTARGRRIGESLTHPDPIDFSKPVWRRFMP
jgi:hypothetical protein